MSKQTYIRLSQAFAVIVGLLFIFCSDQDKSKILSPNNAPVAPSDPSPADNAINVSININLSWVCSDPDEDGLSYDIHFGTASHPPLINSGSSKTNFNPGTLSYNTKYYWQIIAKDEDTSTSGSIWSFTTAMAPNSAPVIPSNPVPANNSNNVGINISLAWTCNDPDGDILTYDIYFGTTSNPTLISSNHALTNYNPGSLSNSLTYYWQIVARDSKGANTFGPIWAFTTGSAPNSVPSTPSNSFPANNATNIANSTSLSWTCSDPDGDALTYDIYFGASSNPPLVSSGYSTTSLNPGTLNYNTKYFWKITARDSKGATTSGAIWSFTTASAPNTAPNLPSSPNPMNYATNVIINPSLSWSCTDPDGDALTFDIYLGTSSNPSLVSSGYSTTSFYPGTLSYNTTYYWQIIARDNKGAVTSGSIWSFTTEANAAPYLIITYPNGGESFKIGQTMGVRWNYSSDSGSRVYIDLYKSDRFYKRLKGGVDVGNDGDHDELLTDDITPGTTYKIRITSTSNSMIYDESDNYFSITSTGSTYLIVTYPNGGESFKIGQTMGVRWNYSSDSGSRVYIDLYKSDRFYKRLKGGVDVGNDGDHDELLTDDITSGNTYKIRITSTTNAAIWDESNGYFTITK